MSLDLRPVGALAAACIVLTALGPPTAAADAPTSSFLVGDGPNAVGFDEASGRAYVGLAYERAVAVIDTGARTAAGKVVGLGVDDLAVDPTTGNAYVAGDSRITRIDAAVVTGDVAAPAPFVGLPFRAVRLTVAPELQRVFVAGFQFVDDGDSGSTTYFLASVDLQTGAVVNTVTTPGFLQDLAVHPGRGHVYGTSPNGVAVFDAATLTSETVVPTEAGAGELALDRDRDRLYVTQQGLDSPVVVVDTATSTVDLGASLPGAQATMAVAVDPQRERVWVARLWGTAPDGSPRGTVDLWTAGAGAPVTTAVGTQPRAIAVRPSTGELWVADEIDDNITVIEPALAEAPAGSLQATVEGGETVSTGTDATAEVPLQTSIIVPEQTSGSLSVTPQETTTLDPSGFTLFGTELAIEGPAATAEAPYQVTFTVDASLLSGVQPADVQVFRDGLVVADCTEPVAAVPDPCVVSRGPTGEAGDDAQVTVRTSHFSTWSLGRLSYELRGPFAPVDPAPVVNTATARAAIPVKFSLGGDRGTDVFAQPPTVLRRNCTSGATDEVEGTAASAASPGLAFDPISGRYTYTWKTTSSSKGCRTLVLAFRDGSQLRMLFTLR